MQNPRQAQLRLVNKGYDIVVDGDFGPASMAALISYVGNKRTVTLLRQELGRAADREFPKFGITTNLRIAHALAQQSAETGGFGRLRESMDYSVNALLTLFSRSRISKSDAEKLGRKPDEGSLSAERQEKIANKLYGGTFGKEQLGNTKKGDGWKFRGRGVKQTTGRWNYNSVKNATGLDVIKNPELLEEADHGMRAGCIFWDDKNCNTEADADDIRSLTIKINGGTNGLDARKAALARAKEILVDGLSPADDNSTSSGSPFEDKFGFTRARREGNRIIVAGTGPIGSNGKTVRGGAAKQAERCCELIIAAIEALGGSASDVVRTRMLLTDFDDQEAVGKVHKRFFGEAKPAATMAGVAWLCDDDWKVEIEAEALVK